MTEKEKNLKWYGALFITLICIAIPMLTVYGFFMNWFPFFKLILIVTDIIIVLYLACVISDVK